MYVIDHRARMLVAYASGQWWIANVWGSVVEARPIRTCIQLPFRVQVIKVIPCNTFGFWCSWRFL
jgi:hypothetical protein